jgi:chromosome segregation ATPase
LLDDLRSEGEQVVNEQIAGLEKAMASVESFTGALAEDQDLAALKAEWQQIQSDLKRALQSGLQAVEDGKTRRMQVVVAEEVAALETELRRKNDVIAQLSDSVKDLNKEREERDKRLREELRALRERLADAEEEIGRLRASGTDLEERYTRLQGEHEAAVGTRDEAMRNASRAEEALLSEHALQEERYAALQAEMNELRTSHSRLENEKRDAERRGGDLEKRLQALEKARGKVESERDAQAQEAARSSKEARAASDRLAALEGELGVMKEKSQKDARRLRKLEGRLRAEGETFRSRVDEALKALKTAAASLESLPREASPSPEPEAEETESA